jgi:hypothetical protein
VQPSTIGGINNLPENEKRSIYARYIPKSLLERFNLPDMVPAYSIAFKIQVYPAPVMWR